MNKHRLIVVAAFVALLTPSWLRAGATASSVSSQNAVTSITGTAGQITASADTGAVTLSLPTALTGINSITAASATDLVLNGGSSGASLTLGQGSNGIGTFQTGTSGYITLGGVVAGAGQALKVVGTDQTQASELALVQDQGGAGARNYGQYFITDATTSDARWIVRTNNVDTTRIKQLNASNRMGFGPNFTGSPGTVNGVDFGSAYWHFAGIGSAAYLVIDDANSPGLLFNNSGNAANSRLWAEVVPNGSTALSWQTWTDARSATTQMALSRTGSLSLTGNSAAVYPASGNGLVLGWNFSNGGGEVDFWNTYTSGASPSFAWYQKTGASAATLLMTLDTSGTLANAGNLTVSGTTGLSIGTVGATLSVKSGANAAAGTVTLVAGAATITSTTIDTNTVIIFSQKTAGGTPGIYQPLAAVGAGSATVTSAATDTSTYNWIALKVAP